MADLSRHIIKIFYCDAQEDNALKRQLATHLSPLRRLRYITAWYDRDVRDGTDWERESQERLDTANLILLLISAQKELSSMAYFRVEEGRDFGAIYAIDQEILNIGRDLSSDIFLKDLGVSHLHASVNKALNGFCFINDAGSTNGTKVNGQSIDKFKLHHLEEGDRVEIGNTVLVFFGKQIDKKNDTEE